MDSQMRFIRTIKVRAALKDTMDLEDRAVMCLLRLACLTRWGNQTLLQIRVRRARVPVAQIILIVRFSRIFKVERMPQDLRMMRLRHRKRLPVARARRLQSRQVGLVMPLVRVLQARHRLREVTRKCQRSIDLSKFKIYSSKPGTESRQSILADQALQTSVIRKGISWNQSKCLTKKSDPKYWIEFSTFSKT